MPAVFTAAIFTALIVLDLVYKNYKDVGFHFSGGIFAVLGLYTACELSGEGMAWILLGIPFLFLLIGLIMIWVDSQKQASPSDAATILPREPECPCPYCHGCPCLCQQPCDQPKEPKEPIEPVGPPSPPLGCSR